ncbi:MAG: TetR/AcrR family transcriptional regulator [Gordonia sp. (in: high G+C Gram-positive bacteria)]|uniref:TetR/AcrR family transcriptional regulator n=1 Tax=Gordonia sp. (in: high G+C Gram-positive bacteria) TaxID=84139 RepID=UPI0039E417B7
MSDEQRVYGGQVVADRARERRERFLAAATEVFGTEGYAGSSVPQICRVAELSSRQFYQEFSDREHVLRELYDRIHDATTQAVADAVFEKISAGTELDEVLDAGVRAFVNSFDDPRVIRIAFVEVVGVSPAFEEYRFARRDRWSELLQSAAQASAAQGMTIGSTTPLQWTAFIGAVNATIVERSLNPTLSDEDIVATMRTLLRPGIVD